MSIRIIEASESFFKRLHKLQERISNEVDQSDDFQVESYSLVCEKQKEIIKNNLPSYYVLDIDEVIAWCFVEKSKNKIFSHRGFLSFGLKKEYRSSNKTVGIRLLKKTIEQAKKSELEKLEASAFAENKLRTSILTRAGFVESGRTIKYKKSNNKYYDKVFYELFL